MSLTTTPGQIYGKCIGLVLERLAHTSSNFQIESCSFPLASPIAGPAALQTGDRVAGLFPGVGQAATVSPLNGTWRRPFRRSGPVGHWIVTWRMRVLRGREEMQVTKSTSQGIH